MNDSAMSDPGRCPDCGRIYEQTNHRCWPSAAREFGEAAEQFVSSITKIDFKQLARDESRRDVVRKRKELRRA